MPTYFSKFIQFSVGFQLPKANTGLQPNTIALLQKDNLAEISLQTSYALN